MTHPDPRAAGAVLPFNRPEPWLRALLEAGVSQGLISREQAGLVRARMTTEVAAPAGRPALALEAGGYLGGALILVAATLLAAGYWDDLGTGAHLGLLGAASLSLLVGGTTVPGRRSRATARLRSVLWLGATGVSAGFLAVLAAEALNLPPDSTAVITTTGTAALAVLLWIAGQGAAQQAAGMLTPLVAAFVMVTTATTNTLLPGLAAWSGAAAWAALSWGGLVPRHRLALCLSGAAMIFASLTTVPADAGLVLALGSTALVVVGGVVLGDIVLLSIGALGTLATLPVSILTWFPDRVAAPLALLATGASLVAVTLWSARRNRPEREVRRFADVGSPALGIAVATVPLTVLLVLLVSVAIA